MGKIVMTLFHIRSENNVFNVAMEQEIRDHTALAQTMMIKYL